MMCLAGTLPSGVRLNPVVFTLIKYSRIHFLKFVFQSLRARTALRSGEVIENVFVLASSNLINVFFLALKAVL